MATYDHWGHLGRIPASVITGLPAYLIFPKPNCSRVAEGHGERQPALLSTWVFLPEVGQHVYGEKTRKWFYMQKFEHWLNTSYLGK